ncbi:mitochondrial carrier domain-containing protein [Hypoxylon crocopeplum]|nr:mitochondrial carrier domain-containing protein [Hypoxylon crocopeplum]
MADLFHEMLNPPSPADHRPNDNNTRPDPVALGYLSTLASMPLSQLESSEQQSLAQSSHSLLLSLQALSKRSHKSIISSAANHSHLRTTLPILASSAADLTSAIPKLDHEALHFSTTYHKSGDNEMLNARKRALLLSKNVGRLVDVLDLPTLLSTAITTGSSSPAANYASALDLNGHIRRLHGLYADSPLVTSVSAQADVAMQAMAKNLVTSLRAPGLKLASALRTISWLRRVVPDLDSAGAAGNGGGLGALFLVCRLSTLINMLAALEPLRELAEQERIRQQQNPTGSAWSGGQQTERYLKRYVEIFREQSFAIVSMFRSIFPVPVNEASSRTGNQDPLQPIPSAMSTFPFHLVEMLMETLRTYLPTVKDQPSRDSLLTQVLYCAGSLGRLGGDFGILLATLDVGDEAEDEWVEVVKRHRLMLADLIFVHFAPPCRRRWAQAAFHFLAGLGSGTFGAVLLQPFDLLKTRVQQSGSHSIRAAVRDIAKSPNALAAFWRGTIPSALRTGVGSAIYFTTLNVIRQRATALSFATVPVTDPRHSSSSLPKLSNTANLVAGAFARAFAGFILMPLTVIKVRYESNLYSYKSIAGAARDIYKTERIPGFFAGFGATAIRDAPYAGLYVVSYEQFKKRLSSWHFPSSPVSQGKSGAGMGSSLSATINFSSGALAGATCSFISNPFDAVKTRIQLQPREYRNMIQACRKMVTEEGVRSLYDGLALRMTRKAMSSALAWMLYEELVRRAETALHRGDARGHV